MRCYSGLFLVPRLPYPPGGGEVLLMGPTKSGLVALRGRALFLAPKAPENFVPLIFLCVPVSVGQSVSGWVPLELSPPPPPSAARQSNAPREL